MINWPVILTVKSERDSDGCLKETSAAPIQPERLPRQNAKTRPQQRVIQRKHHTLCVQYDLALAK
jgi:hypothetical protein